MTKGKGIEGKRKECRRKKRRVRNGRPKPTMLEHRHVFRMSKARTLYFGKLISPD